MEISKIETGDLIFVGIPEQKGESLGNAVASSTGVGTNKIIHVGILEVNINYNNFKEIKFTLCNRSFKFKRCNS